MEILAYSTLPVQHNYFSVEMSSEYPDTSKLNAVGLLNSAIGHYSIFSCTNEETNAFYSVTMKAQTSGVVEIVPIVGWEYTDFYTTEIEIAVQDVDGVETILGFLESPVTTLPSIDCESTSVYKVIVRSYINQWLELASVGIMHTCDCALTSMDPRLMPNMVPANPADASLNVAVG